MNGIVNILKPPGMTSHDVVAYVRKVTGIKKVGHTGTLDPGAAGVLPICIGKGTKIVDYIMSNSKTYICELTLGNKTNTYDKYGDFIFPEDNNIEDITLEEFKLVLEKFKGEILQRPPVFSAIKINGKRSYDLAREGHEIELPKRKVFIYDIEILKFSPPHIILKIQCSKGTYIRSICNDIGDILGCGSYMSFLIRTATGNFKIEESCVLNELNKDNLFSLLTPIDKVLNMKHIYVDEKYTLKLMNGNSINMKHYEDLKEGDKVKIYIKPHNFIGIGNLSNGYLYVEKLLV